MFNNTQKNSPDKKKQPTEKPINQLMFQFYSFTKQISAPNIRELFYITSIGNLSNILKLGILSHKRAHKNQDSSQDISSQSVQELREVKIIERVDSKKRPRSIHRHANLYLNPHNAMMVNIIHGSQDGTVGANNTIDICVLVVHSDILKRGDAIITDKNASIKDAKFFTANAYKLDEKRSSLLCAPEAFGFKLNNTWVIDPGVFKKKDFLKKKKSPSEKEKQYLKDIEKKLNDYSKFRKQNRQAEVLLPYQIHPSYIIGIIVASAEAEKRTNNILKQSGKEKQISVEVNRELFFPKTKGAKWYNDYLSYKPIRKDGLKYNFSEKLPDSSDSEDEGELIKLIKK